MSTSYRKINTLHIVVVIVTLLVVVAIIYPVYWLLMLSLKTELEAFKIPPSFVFIPTFEHYYKLVGGSDFLHSFGNSAICSTGSVLLAILMRFCSVEAYTNTLQTHQEHRTTVPTPLEM